MPLEEPIDPCARMYHALKLVPRPDSLTQSSRSDEGPFSDTRELRERAEKFLETWDFDLLFLICVCARMFVDRVHDRAVFEIKEVGKWVAEFRKAVQKVLEKETEALKHLRAAGKAERAQKYFRSIRFRVLLCEELAQGKEIATALATWEEKEREGDLNDLLALAEGNGPAMEFPKPPPETKASGEVHVYWEFARFVKHKMLFIIVELRHEAGPFFTSTEDHLALAHKAWQYAAFFREVSEKASSPLMAGSHFGRRIAEECLGIVTKLSAVVNRLTEYRKSNYDLSGEVLVDDEAVTRELKEVAGQCVEILNKATQIEQELRQYATAELQGAWTRAFRSAVLTERRTFPVKLFTEPASTEGGALTDALSAILDELDFIEDQHLISTWLTAVLERGITLPERGVDSSLAALMLFRRLLQVAPRSAQQIHGRILSEEWPALAPRSMVALMFTGALTAGAATDSVAEELREIDWTTIVRRVLSGELAKGLEEDDRIALAAGLFVVDVVCRANDVITAKRIAEDFCAVIEKTPERSRRFFAQHFADTLEQHMDQEKQFLKLVALQGVLANHVLWPDKTAAVDVAQQKRDQWTEIRDLGNAI